MADERDKAHLDAFNAKLASGEPVMSFVAHEILRVVAFPTGEAAIDFVFGKSPDNRATVCRLVMGAEAAQTLKASLVANGNIPDTPPTKRDPRSSN
jgi:hypothetical protein